MVSTADFNYVRELIRRESAIVLDDSKEYLVEARLSPVARAAGIETIGDLVNQLKRGSTALQTQVVEALTTNETSFFRDVHPFEALRTDVLPALIEARASTRTLRIWSAASSSGQEAYTIAMVLFEHFPQVAATWNIRILGTDLSDAVLAQAREGRYAQLEVNRGLPAVALARYFVRDGAAWKVKPELRRIVEFQRMNLVAPWPSAPRYDIIFVRNVLIYFDVPTKRNVLEQAHRALLPDGYLFVGSSEMLSGVHDGFTHQRAERATWYQPK